MTIALGILAKRAVILAADTQETIQGYWKINQGKIRAANASVGAILLSAAGSATYCDALMQTLERDFLRNDSTGVLDDWEPRFAERLKLFHAEHVIPFAAIPDHNDRPSVSALVAVQWKHGRALWSTDKSVMVRHDRFAAVGIGSTHANGLLANLARVHHDPLTAAALAAYVLFQVKQHVDGCGDDSEVMYLTKNEYHDLSAEQLYELEKLFRVYARETEPAVVQYLLGANPPQLRSGSRALRSMRSKFNRIMRSTASA
jgi:20S proteasome alpha/beta subunit